MTHTHIQGKVEDLSEGKIYLYRYDFKDFELVDSTSVKDHTFSFTVKDNEPLVYGLSTTNNDQHPQTFFTGEDSLHLSLWKTGKEVMTQNSPLNDEYLKTEVTARSFSENEALAYIAQHKQSPVTAYFITRYWGYLMDYSTLKTLRDDLKSPLSHSTYWKQLDAYVEKLSHLQAGASAPAFVSTGKKCLLVFFASWCPDCQAEMPSLQQFALAHPEVEIRGVSLDKDPKALQAFQQKYPLRWKVECDQKAWDSPIVEAYAVRWIPTTYLISEEGKIIKRK